ncbi:UNVERIFIED_CONTAM: hypothetical protein PYX00_005354 [Menopon gallinae]|uniref:Sfi1 spindle body domain-containing protein n=1 Tax=Menopon gallinae TaxID=328185 RepID=A0AAW2HR01_9NEOP
MKVCNKYPKELAYYNTKLQKRILQKLRDNVWENKTKWQLLLKAEWMYRFRLLRRCLLSWLPYTKRRIQKKKLLHEAQIHYARKITYKTLSTMKTNVERKWNQIGNITHRLNLKKKRRVWHNWEIYVKKSVWTKQVESLMINMREMYLIRSYLEIWFNRRYNKNRHEVATKSAVSHHNRILKRKTVKAWRSYCVRRIHNDEVIAYFSSRFEKKIKGKVFSELMNHMIHKKLYRKHVESVNSFHENYLLQIAMDRWIVKYENLMESRYLERNNSAINLYKTKLIKRSLMKMKVWAAERNLRAETAESFMMVSATIKISFYLELWKKYFELKLSSRALEDSAISWRCIQLQKIFLTKLMKSLQFRLSEKNKIDKFIKYSNSNIMCRAFKQWYWFSHFKSLKRNKFDLARYHYEDKITRRAFGLLQSYLNRKISKRTIIQYYERKLLYKAFDKLKLFWEKKRYYKELTVSFLEKMKRKVLTRAFYVMKNNAVKVNHTWQTISTNADCKVKRMVFQKWKVYSERKREARLLWNQHFTDLRNLVVRELLLIWDNNTKKRLNLKEELKMIRKYRERRIVVKYFEKWVGFINKVKYIAGNCSAFGHLYSEIIILQYISKMKDYYDRIRDIHTKTTIALMLEKRMTYRRFLKKWVTYIAWKKKKLKECTAKTACFRNTGIYPNGCFQSKRRQPMIPHYLTQEFA